MAREVDELYGFHIDDLLDFSNEDIFSSSTVTADTDFHHQPPASTTTSYSFSATTATSSFPNDICLPNEDIAQLEWLSNFVADDDNSLSNFQYATNLTTRTITTTTTTATNIVPGKARSKRSKASTSHHHSWNTSLQSIIPTTTNKFENPLPITIKNPENETYYPASSSFITGRRCTHCASEKTPQWRTGPMGPKTLCNACGVRYKSGRLVPEYRPAASPTFVLTQHSNSHRKVLELRRQKEGMVMEDNNNNSHEFYHHRHNHNFKVC